MSLCISVARMHHISNLTKFRRLKQHAVNSKISGLVKTGKPGVLVFDGERSAIKNFLENARALRYLDFHHVDTQSLPVDSKRLSEGRPGLQEVKDMNALVQAMDSISLKDWFRVQMGMKKDG